MKNFRLKKNLTWRSSDISEEAKSASVESLAASTLFSEPGGEGTVESGLG